MNKEEAIKILKNKHIYLDEYEACEDYETENAIKTILDLYNKEKENNKKLDRENQALYESINCDDNTMLARLYQEEKEKNKILSIQIIENEKLYDKETARLGNLIRELLEERN